MALPVEKDITLYQGDTYMTVIRLRGRITSSAPRTYVDLTGCVGKAQIRATESSSVVIAEFTCTIPNQTVATDKGKLVLSLNPTQTTAATSGVWDVQITFTDNSVKTFVKGDVSVLPGVTRV